MHEEIAHPGSSLRFLRFELDEFRGPHHRHRHFELTWIEQGSGLRSVGDSVLPFDSGDLVLLGPQVPHRWATLRRGRRGSRVIATSVQFEPDLLASSASLPELRSAGLALAAAGRGLQITGTTAKAVTPMLESMRVDDAIARLGTLIAILARLRHGRADLVPLSTHTTRIAPGAVAREDDRRDLVVDWIHARLDREIAAAAAARAARVPASSFSRWFRREIGKTFSDYVNDARCGAACQRLLDRASPIARVAADCGFATLSNFNAQFKRRYGCTPREFRRNGA
jgi:AraC-like DNA-binding protein